MGTTKIVQDEPNNAPPPDAGSKFPVGPAPTVLPLPHTSESELDDQTGEPAAPPAWANDLRELYNAVVEEPLPDNLIDLLSQLDAED